MSGVQTYSAHHHTVEGMLEEADGLVDEMCSLLHFRDGRWQAVGVRWLVSGDRWYVAGGRWQVAGGR